MKNPLHSATFIAALALFAMLFGAGNLIFPLMVGMRSGAHTGIGMLSFLLSAVGIPLLGLIGILLFDGDYERFFGRLGQPASSVIIFICMLIIGPVIGIPRLVSLAHSASTHLVPSGWLTQITPSTSALFSFLFFALVYTVTYKEKQLLKALGIVTGLPLLGGLLALIIKGLITPKPTLQILFTPTTIFKKKLLLGFGTLDLFATLFFCSLLLTILKQSLPHEFSLGNRNLIKTGLKAGLIGLFLICIISIGLGYIGAYYGQGLFVKPGSALTILSFQLFGSAGTAITGLIALLACFSTATALCVVVAEYIHHTVCNDSLSYRLSLLITLLLSLPLSLWGVDAIMRLTKGPLTYIGYPTLLAITLCNIAYKLFGFKTIKTPVLLTFIGASISYILLFS